MAAETSGEMLDALMEAERRVKQMDDMLSDVIPLSVVDKFWEALRMSPMRPDQADEYFSSLSHSAKMLRGYMDSMIRELGSMQHVVEIGAHKASGGVRRKHLVL